MFNDRGLTLKTGEISSLLKNCFACQNITHVQCTNLVTQGKGNDTYKHETCFKNNKKNFPDFVDNSVVVLQSAFFTLYLHG